MASYVLREEPEPLLPSRKKYVAYYADGRPRYIGAETREGAEARLRQFEPDADINAK